MIAEVVKKYRAWKKENPCADFQYDEIGEFFAGFSRGELQGIMEELDSIHPDADLNRLEQEVEEIQAGFYLPKID